MRYRIAVLLGCALIAPLSACHKAEEENVQTQAENASRALEERYRQIEAEAQNSSEEASAPLDAEANALLANQAGNETGLNAQ